MKPTKKDAFMSLYHVDNEVRSKKDSCNAPKKLKRSTNMNSKDKMNENNQPLQKNDYCSVGNDLKTIPKTPQFHSECTSTPIIGDNGREKLQSLSGLGDSPDTGYQSEAKQSLGSMNFSGSSSSSFDELTEYSTPVWSMRYDNGSPNLESKPRKRSSRSKQLFDSETSSFEFAQKLADNLQRRPNLTMGSILAGVIILSTLITMYRLSSIQSFNGLDVKTWSPSTLKGRQNGKYASMEYAHEMRSNREEFKVVDEDGNLLGGKKASIAYAFDSRKKKEQHSDGQVDSTANGSVEKELERKENLSNLQVTEEESSDEEDYYEAMQLLDDLKRMGDLLKQRSSDSESTKPDNSLDMNDVNNIAEEERLKKLKAFENFATTKLRPLDLGLDDQDPIERNSVKGLESESKTASFQGEENTVNAENVQSENSGENRDNIVSNKKKRNKSFNKLYNAYSAKILRLIEKKKNRFQSKVQNQKSSSNEEEDPFRFV